MKHLSQQQVYDLDNRYRAHLINSLSGFKSANLIGTADNTGAANLAIFSSVIHLGASPALVGFIMRPDSAERHTLSNIKALGQYTINQVNRTIWQQAHQTSARYLKTQSEFEETGLTPEFKAGISAPFVKESQLKYALRLREIMPISLNKTMMIIGEITDIYYPSQHITSDGYIDIEALDTVAVTGLDNYHVGNRLGRLSYAKPDTLPQIISDNKEV
ncbi:flavin reductase family protein [Thalassotalea eurytherma]|uniref:Flavin oxidoreductase n=1 Tax=Thalassotalea eurytherma TaxID=1144278 RepID=A0ABQ6H051_9GAMM|nr:flavin reductase [Thalassotalea eurytherma]GLX80977.1 flavin oxidoreductase [Thalassotalea eurytherma]